MDRERTGGAESDKEERGGLTLQIEVCNLLNASLESATETE